jgi:hypothetical protein
MRQICLVLAVSFCAAAALATPPYVWWEAESPVKTDFPDSSSLSPRNDRERDVLSGGAWLSCDHGKKGASATYRISVAQPGSYELWVRRFGYHGPFEWRFDEGSWQPIRPGSRSKGSMPLDITGDRYIAAGWQGIGGVELAKGGHTFEFRLTNAGGLAAIDCFVLVQGQFAPHGRIKPGEKYDRAPEGWFAFEPDRDEFQDSAIDMSRLNDAPAGTKGRIIKRGADLVFAKTGEKVRFWGVTGVSSVWKMDKAEMDYLARRLAKMGVNMVRFHVAPFYEAEPGPLTDGVHYLSAALKKQGIYSGFNWYCLAVARVQDSWGLEGFKQGDRPMSLHLFYPPMQKVYKRWAKTLFGTPNPYTGLSLGKDPAVAYIELIDEDNYLFWTFDPANINPRALPFVEREFGAWAAKRHGSIEKALAAWGDGPKPKNGTDDPSAGRLGLYAARWLGGGDWQRSARNPRRASDQLRFFTDDIRDFNAGMKQWLRDEVGYDGLVVATNWKTVDERVVGPLDQYGNMAVDVTARNTYFSGPHKRVKFHPWMVGDSYMDKSLLLEPHAAITMHMQQAGYPHFITEGGWAMPNRFRTEEQLIMASYASLQGIDGLFPFVVEGDWSLQIKTWPIQTPATMGQYPAASLIYRKGYVKEGPIAINEALRLEDLYEFKGAALSQPLGLDEARAADVPEGVRPEVDSLGTLDPMAFYVGRVMQTVAADPGRSELLRGLPKYIDRERKIVRSATGELTLDYGRGVLTLDAPCAKGATGFLGAAGEQHLGVVTVRMDNEYGAVMCVSLDGLPIERSARILVQVMSEEKTYAWETRSAKVSFRKNADPVDAKEITNVGLAPIVVRQIRGEVVLTRSDAEELTVTALDPNGYSRRVLPAGRGGQVRIELLPDCLYYVVSR